MANRLQRSIDIRVAAANRIPPGTVITQTPNGDEADLPDLAGNYSKGLPHDKHGLVDPAAYQKLVTAMTTGDRDAFEDIPLGDGHDPLSGANKLTSPQAGLCFDLEGADGQALTLPAAPALRSAEAAAEMAELYWMALLRDVPFARYESNPDAAAAAASLSAYGSDFRGPKEGGAVTPKTLFRGIYTGDEAGPFLSQFLLMGSGTLLSGEGGAVGAPAPGAASDGYVQYGSLRIDQRQRTVLPGTDYLTRFSDTGSGLRRPNWLDVQNGVVRFAGVADVGQPDVATFEPQRLFLRNLRDLATWVHYDALYEAYLNAALLLLSLDAPPNAANPYAGLKKQKGFATFGGPHLLSLVTEVATRALKAVWFQKWGVHRRLRPEEYGGRVHLQRLGVKDFGLHASLMGDDALLQRVFAHNQALNGDEGSYLLPMAFPEGCPTHPSYGAGHATVAGACVTILKAWFDEGHTLTTRPLAALEGGDKLVILSNNTQLTVGGELNKLAANIAIGRNGAGVHWRSDYTQSLLLGEQVAVGILREQRPTYNELPSSSPWTLTGFKGDTIQI